MYLHLFLNIEWQSNGNPFVIPERDPLHPTTVKGTTPPILEPPML